MRNRLNLRRNKKGFTLIELLVVVLILAILMAVALPLYVSSVADASQKTCRANMQSIANAAQAWKVKGRKVSYSGVTVDLLADDLGSTPKTPNDGTYTIATSGAYDNGFTGADAVAGNLPTGDALFAVKSVKSGGTGSECGDFVPGLMNK